MLIEYDKVCVRCTYTLQRSSGEGFMKRVALDLGVEQ